MARNSEPPTSFVQQFGLAALAVLSGLLAFLVLAPYLQYVLFGVVLAYIAFPIQQRAERYVRATTAALAVVVGMLLLVLIPLIYVIILAVRQSLRVERAVRSGQLDVASVESLIEAAGYSVDLAALYGSNQERIASVIQAVTSMLVDFVGGLPGLFIGLTITLFVLFSLLRDGAKLVAWVKWVLPIDEDIQDELFEGLDNLMWASVVGNVLVAAIQAVLLGIGLAIAGLPAVIFLTVATFVLTLLPLVGAFGVWIPSVLYLVAAGRPVAGAAVTIYGTLISVSDLYLRPALIGRSGPLNSTIIVIGIFGGLVVFGAVGLFIGPVVVGGAKLVFDCFARTHTRESIP